MSRNNRENVCLKMPRYLCVSTLEKKTIGNIFLPAYNMWRRSQTRGNVTVRYFPDLGKPDGIFLNAVNIPLWNVSQRQRDVLMLSSTLAPHVAWRSQAGWQTLGNLMVFFGGRAPQTAVGRYTLGARGHKTQHGGWRDHSETGESKNNSALEDRMEGWNSCYWHNTSRTNIQLNIRWYQKTHAHTRLWKMCKNEL